MIPGRRGATDSDCVGPRFIFSFAISFLKPGRIVGPRRREVEMTASVPSSSAFAQHHRFAALALDTSL